MMRLSQTAPETVKGTHYTTLATFEVLGKLLFAALSGYLIDRFGIETMYISFVAFAILTIPLIIRAPMVVLNSQDKINKTA